MNKTEFIELLKDYKENKARLNIKLKELKTARWELKNISNTETKVTVTYGQNQDIHSKNQISDKVFKKIEENDSKREKLEKKIINLENEVKSLRDKVDAVEDRLIGLKYKEREILTAYYVEGMSAEDIGNRLYFQLFSQTRSGRHIQRIIEKATEKMVKL